MSYWQRGKRAAIMAARLAVVLATTAAFNYIVSRWLGPALLGGWLTTSVVVVCLAFVVGESCSEAAARFVTTGRLRANQEVGADGRHDG